MKPPAYALMKLHTTLSALVLSASAALAQTPDLPQPVPPATTPGTNSGAAVAPTPATTTGSAVAPAPIEPPVQSGTGLAAPGAAPNAESVTIAGGDPTARRVSEFSGDPVDVVLRTLARQAKMNVVVSPAVQGTINLRLEDKTPREVIDVVVQANGLTMDELSGVYYIKTAGERAKEPTEPFQYTFSYAQADKIAPLLKTQLSSGLAPDFDIRTNTIFYREGKSNADKIRLFLESVDSPTQQVMIEARLVEVNANPKQSYGINWGGVVGGSANPQTFQYGGSTPGSAKVENGQVQVDKLPAVETTRGKLSATDFLFDNSLKAIGGQFAILSVPQLSATLRLLNEDTDTEFLANPRVVASNNQKATIKITRTQPVPQLNFNEQTAQAVFGGFEDKEFGNSLIVTPSINKDSFISLTVQPEISNKVGDATFQFGGATVASPIIDKRTFDSNVLIKSGDTLAIGGLLQDEVSKGRTKVPVLGDIPLFGYVFQEKVNTRTKRNLLVFVTPTIIKQGYGTGLESQVTGLTHVGEEYADPTGWRNNAKGAIRIVPTSNRQVVADYPKPGIAPAPARVRTTRTSVTRTK
jgi:type IV pilus assembly protein PilQ